jgi:tRNA(Ile2) C34 agmatinyltransferase TiaS
MTARPELPESIWVGDTLYLPVCPDCGQTVRSDDAGRLCRSCYDAYVENAGR